MNVVVTGASGFVGQVLVRQLAGEGHDVTGLVGRSAPPPGSAARYVRADFGEDELSTEVRCAVAKADAIAHLAAARKDWGLTTEAAHRINVTSGSLLLRHARNAARFVLASSQGVHGYTKGPPVDESSPFAPYDSYGRAKVAAECALNQVAKETGVTTAVVRFGILYGPGDSYGMVTNMIRLIAQRRFLCVGAGKSRVQILHVADAAAGVRAALVRPEAAGQTLLLAGSQAVMLAELAHAIARRLGVWLPPLHVPEPFARAAASVLERAARLVGTAKEPFLTHSKINLMTRDYLCDTSRAAALLGFHSRVPIENGIDETVTWLDEHGMRAGRR
jgi:UDP-glucose 4-epimerase